MLSFVVTSANYLLYMYISVCVYKICIYPVLLTTICGTYCPMVLDMTGVRCLLLHVADYNTGITLPGSFKNPKRMLRDKTNSLMPLSTDNMTKEGPPKFNP